MANSTTNFTPRNHVASAFAALAAVLVLAAVFAPFVLSRSVLLDLFFILTMLTMAQAWNLLAGYAGLVSVGQQAFVGVGAYTMFALVILAGIDPVFSILAAGVAAALLSILTGFFVFRLQGAYFAIGTWVTAEIARLLLAQWKTLGGGTGTSLPPGTARDMFGVDLAAEIFGVRAAHAADIVCYLLALGLACLTIGAVYLFLRTRQGLGLAAVRDNPVAARAVGVDGGRLKWAVWIGAAFIAGMTGALIYIQTARISPDAAFSVIDWTAYVIFIVVIGGIGPIEGPIIGVVVFFLLQNTLSDYGTWYLLILGLIGIAIMLFAPRGLWGLVAHRTHIQPFPIRRTLAVEGAADRDRA